MSYAKRPIMNHYPTAVISLIVATIPCQALSAFQLHTGVEQQDQATGDPTGATATPTAAQPTVYAAGPSAPPPAARPGRNAASVTPSVPVAPSTIAGEEAQDSTGLSLTDVVNWQIVSTFLAMIATFFGFLGSQYVQRRAVQKEEDRRFRVAINNARNEIEFYISKLNILTSQVQDALDSLDNRHVLVPSYTFYPSLLEQLKVELASFLREEELIKQVGHCHFELAHVVERLDTYKSRVPDKCDPAYVTNVEGFKSLVDATVSAFESTRHNLEEWLNNHPAKQGACLHAPRGRWGGG